MPALKCPFCKQSLGLASIQPGAKIECPHCGRRLVASNQAADTKSLPIGNQPTGGSPPEPARRTESDPPRLLAGHKVDNSPAGRNKRIADAAHDAVRNSRYLAYAVLAATVLLGVVALVTLAYGAAGNPWLAAGFVLCLVAGTGLFLNYRATRHDAYDEALAIERARGEEEVRERDGGNSSVPTIVGSIVTGLFVLLAGVKGFRFASAGRALSSGGLNVLGIVGGLAVGMLVFAMLCRFFGGVRALSVTQLAGALLVGLWGVAAVTDGNAVAEKRTVNDVITARSEKEVAAETAVREADARVANLCVIPANFKTTKFAIERHGRNKIAFVEIDCTQLSDLQRNYLWSRLRDIPGNEGNGESSDRNVIEVVCGPIDDLTQFAAKLIDFEVLETDMSRQRIQVRPNIERLDAQFKNALR
jgi:DNA-directed RNA polymerase subunit RPC12/RpoP